MLADPDFIPFEPPIGSNPGALKRNTVETIPRALYEAPRMVRYKRLISDAIVLTDPELIHQLLVAEPEAFRRDELAVRLLVPLLGRRSLLMAEGADWRWQRRAAAPAFRHDSLLELVPLMTAAAGRQIEAWRGAPADQPVDVSIDMTKITFEIITETLFGRTSALDFDAFGDTLMDYSSSLRPRAVLSFMRLPAWTPFPGRARSIRGRDRMRSLIRASINDHGGGAPSGLFEMLANAEDLETGRRQTEEEFVNNIATFLNAGHETTAVALTWTLWLLSKDLESQERVAAEAIEVLGEGPLRAADIEKLSFTRQVTQEPMRLYPPAPALARRPIRPMNFGGQQVTPRTQITVAIYPLHRNKGLWDRPDAFDPERFAPDKVKARPRHVYMPFGAGQRICIGATFSMIEATAVLAELVRAYRFKAMPGYRPQIWGHVTMRPHEGMPLFITPRGPARRRTRPEPAQAAA